MATGVPGAPAKVGNGLRRFSLLALASVAVLTASGVVLTWREVGSVEALIGTTFGRVLLAKVAAVIGLLAVANLARRWVADSVPLDPDAPSGSSTRDTRRWTGFLRGLAAEAALAGMILALTAALVAIVPGRQAVATGPGSSTSRHDVGPTGPPTR